MAAAKAKTKPGIEAWMYDIIDHPHVTEKSTLGSEHGQVSFVVPKWATKPKIKQAVEALFDVEVKAVNTVVQKGKEKRFRGIKGQQSDFKKAMVTLKDGQAIDVSTGV